VKRSEYKFLYSEHMFYSADKTFFLLNYLYLAVTIEDLKAHGISALFDARRPLSLNFLQKKDKSCSDFTQTQRLTSSKENAMEFKALAVATVFLLSTAVQAGSLVRLRSKTFDPTDAKSVGTTTTQTSKTWIISFSTPITEQLKSEIRAKGFQILQFLPDSSLVVRGNKPVVISHQEAWVPFNPAWKWSDHLQNPSLINESQYQIVMIRTYTNEDGKQLKTYLDKMDKVFILNSEDSYFVLRATMADIYRISTLDEVANVSQLPEFKTMNIDLGVATNQIQANAVDGYETGTKVMNFDTAWAAGFHGEGQIVAMGDTGVDTGNMQTIHPDFTNAILSGRNFAPFGRAWEDPMGHGTHVAGSVVSRGTASGGAFKGGAYGAQLVVHSLWSPMMHNLMLPTNLSDMFQAAVQSGASVHTNSWGQAKDFGSYDSYARQVDEFMFNNPDLLILFAAGNSGVDMDKDGRIDPNSIGSPGTAKNTLTVGASKNYELTGGIQRKISDLKAAKDEWSAEPIWSSSLSDNPHGLAMFSSRGPTADGRVKPEIVAPGTNILSTFSHYPGAEVLWGKYDDNYVWSGGTSMATPLTAGAAAVSRQILQQKFNQAKPSSSLLKAFMMSFATDLYPGQYGEGGAQHGQEILIHRPNNDEGFGLVDMKSEANSATTTTQVYDQKSGLATGESQEFTFTMPKDGVLSVVLVWNDAPAAESAGKALVNDLNLEVSGPSVQYTSNDSVNNFEFFEKSASAGTYKVKVVGQQIPQGINGKQPFSLVIRTQ
jgi:subtilisin family serine protease